MFFKRLILIVSLIVILTMALTACQQPAKPTETPVPTKNVTFGMLLVGPYNDHGWSQAHYEAGKYVEGKLPGSKMLYLDNVNISARPDTTPAQLAEELVNQGANVIIFNSDDMKDKAVEFAKAHPEILVIHASGDTVWKENPNAQKLDNLTNIMGRMEYGKMIAGCAAALTTKTGQIGYLGPLINSETRRLASSAYLGAKYCYEKYAGKDPATLQFKVTWIGFWFNIPGMTSDPTQVADDFFNSGFDVVISGIDTTEAIKEAAKMTAAGKEVWAVPYDFQGACDEAPAICLGVPYFNWGPAYLTALKTAGNSTWQSHFEWNSPDWSNINNVDTSAVGFVKGSALTADAGAKVDQFIAELAGGLNLWKGPLNLQDGTPFIEAGKTATDVQVWYLEQLLEGMEGKSVDQQ
jgi:simple sugar transport system substrate-binding protein